MQQNGRWKVLHHILIIDDDDGIRDLLAKFLTLNGYAVSAATNTTEAEELLKEFSFDALIIDLLMPGEGGLDFLKRVTVEAPVLMLTALSGIDDRILGLESGAEDYIAKPFEPRELLLRLQKIIRRRIGNTFISLKSPNEMVDNAISSRSIAKFGQFTYDIEKGLLKRENNRIYLTTSESRLLSILAAQSGQIVTRNAVAEALSDVVSLRTVDTQIARLRNKIEKDSKKAEYLQTIRGTGYILWATITNQAT